MLSTINNFKIRASYGVMGDDNALDYQFLAGYTYPATVLNHSGDPIPGGYFFDGIYVNGLAVQVCLTRRLHGMRPGQ